MLRTKITSVISLPSCPPNFCSSDSTSPQPSPFWEGVGHGLSGTLSLSRKGRGKSTSRFTLHPSLKKQAAFTLAEGATHVVHFDDIRRAAFTLAEVLITLGIIGVVAAMTMPSVIGHYKKQETISKLKKAYTSINQALKMSEIDNGEYEYWDEGFGLGAEQYLQKYWLPYFNVLKICKSYDECGYQSVYPWTLLNGNQSSLIFSNPNYRIPFITTDGILYSISIAKGEDDDYTTNSQIHIDINSSKGPNIYGKDIFVFTRVKDKGILPYCYEYTDNKIASSCSKTGDGTCCSQLIMMNGWQFPKDYPY